MICGSGLPLSQIAIMSITVISLIIHTSHKVVSIHDDH